jgi:hypothetical protein
MRWRIASAQSGFTYLWLLFALAFASYGWMNLGEHWALQSQRELEREQMFRGQQIVAALKSYAATTPTGMHCAPRSLEELLQDARVPGIRRHLRRIYGDPLTGLPDWELLRDALGGVVGVRSRSTRPLVSGLSRKAVAGNSVGRVFQVVEGVGPGAGSLCAPMVGAVNPPSTPASGSTPGVAR